MGICTRLIPLVEAMEMELRELLPGGRRGGWVGYCCILREKHLCGVGLTPLNVGAKIAPGSVGALPKSWGSYYGIWEPYAPC